VGPLGKVFTRNLYSLEQYRLLISIKPMKAKVARDSRNANFAVVPVGIALGAGAGAYLGNMSMGMGLGIMLGATFSMIAEHRQGKRSVIWPVVGGGAVLWTLGLLAIERM
jgi:hypothetical protein